MEFDNQYLLAEKMSVTTCRGYWTVAGKIFFNKAECLKYASKVKNPHISFNFMNSVYNTLDWTKEPTEDLNELYRLRAEQIRSNYDYVALFYSGGADSTNILDTFLDNNIHIDEIVSCYPISVIEKSIHTFSIADKRKENIMFEYTLAAQPKLKEVEKRSPKTKITVIDYTSFAVNFILAGKMNKIFQGGLAADPYHASHYYFAEKMKEVAEGKSICAVTGIDKPRLIYDMVTDKFGLVFLDFLNLFGNFSKESLDGYLPSMQHFYYTPLLPSLIQKQCFMLARALREKGMTNPVSAKNILLRCRDNRFLIYDSHTTFFKNVIYNKWNDNTWQADKDTTNYFFQSQTQWFHDTTYTNQRERDYYSGQIKELTNGIDDLFLERTKEGNIAKFKDYLTKPIWF